jgi:hypothetical protein
MADEERERRAEKWKERTDNPYVAPSVAAGQHEDTPERVAQALEYIAAQLGMMNGKMDTLIAELAKLRGGSPG